MARWAMVDDSNAIIVNIIEWNGNEDVATGGWEIPEGITMVEETEETGAALIGGSWNGQTFDPPEYDEAGSVIVKPTKE